MVKKGQIQASSLWQWTGVVVRRTAVECEISGWYNDMEMIWTAQNQQFHAR